MAGGVALMEAMWKKIPARARTEYEWLTGRFTKFSEDEPGTHPRYDCCDLLLPARLFVLEVCHIPEFWYCGYFLLCNPLFKKSYK